MLRDRFQLKALTQPSTTYVIHSMPKCNVLAVHSSKSGHRVQINIWQQNVSPSAGGDAGLKTPPFQFPHQISFRDPFIEIPAPTALVGFVVVLRVPARRLPACVGNALVGLAEFETLPPELRLCLPRFRAIISWALAIQTIIFRALDIHTIIVRALRFQIIILRAGGRAGR